MRYDYIVPSLIIALYKLFTDIVYAEHRANTCRIVCSFAYVNKTTGLFYVLFFVVFFVVNLQWFPAHSVNSWSGVGFYTADTVTDIRRDIISFISQHLYTVQATNASQHAHHLLAPIL